MGLSLCKRFVELMGGEIAVTSEPGEGSVFSFSIRLLPAPVVGAAPEAKPVEPSHEPPLRTLLVDDYEANRLVVKAFLKNLPWKIDEALDGAEGVAAFKESD